MSHWRLIQLQFGRSPAHFGEVGIGLEATSERVRSDTLFSAWMTAYAQLFGGEAVAALLAQFQTAAAPPLQLSSTFIYQQDQEHLCFYLPRPHQLPPKYPIGEDFEFAKDYRKLHYLPLAIWKRWYQEPQGFDRSDLDTIASQISYSKAYAIEQVPKVAVDRTTRGTNFFHTGYVHYRWQLEGDEVKSQSGLYFLVRFKDSQPIEEPSPLEKNLHAALLFLGEEGMGGERSTGAGRFQVQWQPLPEVWQSLVAFDGGSHHSLISLFWEQPLDVRLLNGASYDVQERGGWVTSPFSGRQLRRQSVRMFTEGSVFAMPPKGQLADVTPQEFIQKGEYRPHPIYRSGFALSLPINVLQSGGR